MARIRARHTTPERRLRAILWGAGLRYRLHYRTPEGRPDIVFPGRKVAIFIDGCFWHGCPLHYVRPRTKEEFWSKKLRENVERDDRQTLALEAKGWRVVRLWEHDLDVGDERVLLLIQEALNGDRWIPRDFTRVMAVRQVEGAPEEIWTMTHLRDSRITEERRYRGPRRTS